MVLAGHDDVLGCLRLEWNTQHHVHTAIPPPHHHISGVPALVAAARLDSKGMCLLTTQRRGRFYLGHD